MSALTRVYTSFVMFSALAYSFWYNLLGPVGTAILLVVLSAISAVAYLRWRRHQPARGREWWRHRPWLIYGYVTVAGLSLIWSAWPLATGITWGLLALFTMHGLILTSRFSGGELLDLAERALAAILLLSLAMELWVSLVVRHAILPNFSEAPPNPNPQWYWVRGNLLDGFLTGGRIQGIVGNANLIAALCVVALIIFATQIARKAPYAPARWALAALALWLCIRASSAMMFVTLAALVVVALIVLLFRRVTSRKVRAVLYCVVAALFLSAIAVLLFARDALFALLGRGSDLTGRADIWAQVISRAQSTPVFGHGFASPWLPWDPAFDGWITDHGITVFHSHNMWLDVFLQLGAVGVVLLGSIYALTLWRAWQLAIHPDRSVRHITPLLLVTTLVLQGLTESAPLMYWGWMLITVLYTMLAPSQAVPSKAKAPHTLTPA